MTLSTQDFNTLCSTAQTAARKAGEYIQSQFNQHYEQKTKEGGNSLASQIVTEVDLKAQDIILKHLKDSITVYDLGLLTEEAADDSSRLRKDYFWCVDPMDGTIAFTERRTTFAVSIALVSKSGDPMVAVVYVPHLEDSYSAVKGEGVLLNGKAFEPEKLKNHCLHFFRDKSLELNPYYKLIIKHLNRFAKQKDYSMQEHVEYGAVHNALSVLHYPTACYIKFPQKKQGGGSIWDFAATRLLFEECSLQVSDSFGCKLFLNNPESTFMNTSGVLYTTHGELHTSLIKLSHSINLL